MRKTKFSYIIKFLCSKSVGEEFTSKDVYDYLKSKNFTMFITSADSYLSLLKLNGYLKTSSESYVSNKKYKLITIPSEDMNTKMLIEINKKRTNKNKNNLINKLANEIV